MGHECDSFYYRRPVEGLLPSFMDPIFESPILFKAGLCRRLRATGVSRRDDTMPNRSGWVVLAMSTGAKAVACAITKY